MKVKSIVCGTLAILACTQVFALDITKGHLISHKEWTTGNAKGHFVASNAQAFQKSKMMGDPVTNSNNESYTNIDVVNTVSNMPVTITGNNYVRISNDSDMTQHYRVSYRTCSQIDPTRDIEDCIFYSDIIALEPHGSFSDMKAPELQETYNVPGTYQTSSDTFIVSTDSFDVASHSLSEGEVKVS
jgi:hypothetical protein